MASCSCLSSIFGVCSPLLGPVGKFCCGRAKAIYDIQESIINLKESATRLDEKNLDVMKRVLANDLTTYTITDEVDGWSKLASETIDVVEIFLEDFEGEVKVQSSICSLCKGLKKADDQATAMLKFQLKIDGLLKAATFKDNDLVVQITDSNVYAPSFWPHIGFDFKDIPKDLTKLISENFITALVGDHGSGRTTLLKYLRNHYYPHWISYIVIILEGSGLTTKDLRDSLVDEILKLRLGIKSSTGAQAPKPKPDQANVLRQLANRKFIILIDNLSADVQISDIGIPYPKLVNGCKIMFSCLDRVTAIKNGARLYQIQPLSQEKGIKLLQAHLGAQPFYEKEALQLLELCLGLPKAIVVVSKLLKNAQEANEWETLHLKLKDTIEEGIPEGLSEAQMLEEKKQRMLKINRAIPIGEAYRMIKINSAIPIGEASSSHPKSTAMKLIPEDLTLKEVKTLSRELDSKFHAIDRKLDDILQQSIRVGKLRWGRRKISVGKIKWGRRKHLLAIRQRAAK